mgnify:CR=1 FL=1
MKFRLAADVRFRVVDGEAVVIVQERGEVLGLNGTGSTAFQLAADGHELDAIIDSIAVEHDAERDVVAADVRAFFATMVTDGLLVEVSA